MLLDWETKTRSPEPVKTPKKKSSEQVQASKTTLVCVVSKLETLESVGE